MMANLRGELTSCGSKQASRKVETKSSIVRPHKNSMKVPTNPIKAKIQLRIVKGRYDFGLDWICCNRISSVRLDIPEPNGPRLG